MKKRQQLQAKTLSHSSVAPGKSMFQRRPFGVQPQPAEVSHQEQKIPDLQTQLEKAKRCGFDFAKIPIFSADAPPPPIIQPKLTLGQFLVQRQLEPVNVSTAPLGLLQRMVVPTNLHAFGNMSKPRDPRPGKDIEVDKEGYVSPTDPPTGASTFGDVNKAPLTGHYHRLTGGKTVTDDIGIIADGTDVGGTHKQTHHTIYPAKRMPAKDFVNNFQSLGWEYVEKKK